MNDLRRAPVSQHSCFKSTFKQFVNKYSLNNFVPSFPDTFHMAPSTFKIELI